MKKLIMLFIPAVFLSAATVLNANAIENFVTLTYPNGGEQLIAGADCIITWTPRGEVTNVKLEYSTDGGATFNIITDSTENDGAYTWYLPNAISSNYLVRISEADGAASDTSDARFSIIPAHLILTYPNSGCLKAGWNYDITWMTVGSIDNVKIEYSTDGGNTFQTIIASTPNTGRYPWTVPDTLTSHALIKVSDLSGNSYDVRRIPGTQYLIYLDFILFISIPNIPPTINVCKTTSNSIIYFIFQSTTNLQNRDTFNIIQPL